jgi:hypothetical protein
MKLGLRKLKKRYGRAAGSLYVRQADGRVGGPTHLLVDWANIACRKRNVDTSKLYSSRDPGEVTCDKCKKAQPHYDWARLEEFRKQGGR